MTTDMQARDEAEFEAWWNHMKVVRVNPSVKMAYLAALAAERSRSAAKLEKAKERRVFQKIKLTIAFEALEKIAVMENDAAPLATTAMRRIYSVNKMTVTAADSGDEK